MIETESRPLEVAWPRRLPDPEVAIVNGRLRALEMRMLEHHRELSAMRVALIGTVCVVIVLAALVVMWWV